MISSTTDPAGVQAALDEIEKMQAPDPLPETPPARHPEDTEVALVGGLLDISGVTMTATVRELNGRDEEAIARCSTEGKRMNTILYRGVELLGDEKATQDDLDSLLAADRDLLLMHIRRVTFGPVLEGLEVTCPKCGEKSEMEIDLLSDVPIKYLDDPVGDRAFSVELRNGGVAELRLPTGMTQKKVAQAWDEGKTASEMNTMFLFGCVKSINGRDVLGQEQVLSLGIADRNKIITELSERIPGPQWNDVVKECPVCEEEVPLPLSADLLFRV